MTTVTKEEVRHNIMNAIMHLKYVEQDCILDVLDDYLDPYIDELEEENNEAKTIIKLLLWDLRNKDYDCIKDVEKAEEFLKEIKI